MQPKLYSILVLLFFITTSFTYSEPKQGHYFDVGGNSLPQYDFIYDELTKYFKDSVPQQITIIYSNGVTSQFNPKNESVLINESAVKYRAAQVVGHESCHLSMFNFTKGASDKEKFRFFDEGFACIYESMLAKNSDVYKKNSLNVAALQNLQNNVTFAKVQKWSEYFGNPNISTHYYAYPVGSSFDYYVIDTYGMDFFLKLCMDIGDTSDLDVSCRNVFKKDQKTIEAEWQLYLKKVPVTTTPPRIVKMFPENKATGVSTKISEIYVEFDVPMNTDYYSVISDSVGVSYKNAFWKSDKILAVKVNLVPNHCYTISLGRSSNQMMGADYIEFPPTTWSFTTGSE